METPSGVSLPGLPVALKKVRDITFFEGPLLSEFASPANEPFLYHWCDCDAVAHRWLVLRTARTTIIAYEAGQRDLHEVISQPNDGFCYLVDTAEGIPRAVHLVTTAQIPREYVPQPGSFFDEATIDVESDRQNVLLTQGWRSEEVAIYPRKYLQAYAFTSFFDAAVGAGKPRTDYKLKGGYVFHTMYERWRHQPAMTADLAAMNFSSPGHARFRVSPPVARALRYTVKRYMESESQIKSAAKTMRAWANGHEPALTTAGARNLMLTIGAHLEINIKKLLRDVDRIEDGARILWSYLSRLSFLAAQQRKRHAILLGVPTPGGPWEILDDSD